MFHFLEYPFSRGETHIVSPDPYEAPDFDAGFMNDERDMAPMVWGYIKSRQYHLPPSQSTPLMSDQVKLPAAWRLMPAKYSSCTPSTPTIRQPAPKTWTSRPPK